MTKEEIKKRADEMGITPEVYLFLIRSERKMKYFSYDLKVEHTVNLCAAGKVQEDDSSDLNHEYIIPSREDSLDRLLENGKTFAADQKSVEDLTIESLLHKRLFAALSFLDDAERRLIYELFFSCGGRGKSERKAAKVLGIPQKTLNNRKKKILSKLKKSLESEK